MTGNAAERPPYPPELLRPAFIEVVEFIPGVTRSTGVVFYFCDTDCRDRFQASPFIGQLQSADMPISLRRPTICATCKTRQET